MDHLHWPLSVLGKAIHHKNLSAAADHIGLSQPQLSRLIAKLEEELGVVLLDRTARRKSGWTPVAYKVADVYFRNSRRLTAALGELQSDDQVQHLSIGTLEGLVPIAIGMGQRLFKDTKIPVVELNVYDLSELEERFEKDELDLILTCREPGRAKHKNLHLIGWQDLAVEGRNRDGLKALSPFEYAQLIQTGKRNASKREKHETASHKLVVSNSLALRRLFIDEHGAQGSVPSEVRAKQLGTSTEQPVYLLGSEILPTGLWEKLCAIPLLNENPRKSATPTHARATPTRQLPTSP